jgi:hypothetical protein
MSDVVVPKLRKTELAAKVTQEHPDLAVLFLSGYTEEALSRLHGQGRISISESLSPSTRCCEPRGRRWTMRDRPIRCDDTFGE